MLVEGTVFGEITQSQYLLRSMIDDKAEARSFRCDINPFHLRRFCIFSFLDMDSFMFPLFCMDTCFRMLNLTRWSIFTEWVTCCTHCILYYNAAGVMSHFSYVHKISLEPFCNKLVVLHISSSNPLCSISCTRHSIPH